MLDQFLDPLDHCLDAESARRVLALGLSASVQERVDAVAERANEGLFDDDEHAEYEALIKRGRLSGNPEIKGAKAALTRSSDTGAT
jgi:hypothetical protein